MFLKWTSFFDGYQRKVVLLFLMHLNLFDNRQIVKLHGARHYLSKYSWEFVKKEQKIVLRAPSMKCMNLVYLLSFSGIFT